MMKTETKFLTATLFLLMCASVVLGVYPQTFTQVVTDGGQSYTLQMQKVSLRGSNFEVLVQNSSGGYDAYTPDDVATYMGEVVESPDAIACAVILDNGDVQGVLYFDRGKHWYFTNETATKVNGFNDSQNVPNWTGSTLLPGTIGTDTWRFDLGFDLENDVLAQKCFNDVSLALDKIELSAMVINTIYVKNTMLQASIGRVIIRGSLAHCPYSALDYNALTPLYEEWLYNQSDAVRDVVAGIRVMGGGVATGGSIGNANGVSQNGVDSDGVFHGVWKHELGHNWGCGDYQSNNCEGKTIMCGNARGMFSGGEVAMILRERNEHTGVGGALDNLGVFTAVPVPPYAALDPFIISQGQVITIDVLANDFDANADSIDLLSVDVISDNGGRGWISIGTGPGGRDEVQYMPAGVLGLDKLEYQIIDATGKTQTGWVLAMVDEFASEIYEAEDAVVVGAVVDGTFVDYINASNDYIEWTINVSAAGDYDLAFYYDYPGNDRPLEIKVDGVVKDPSFDFPDFGTSGYD